MFNPVPASEITIAVGRVLKQAAAAEGGLDEYQRSQLLSAYSITRRLAVEQETGDALRAWYRERLGAELGRCLRAGEPPLEDLSRRAEQIAGCRGPDELGKRTTELLRALRGAGGEGSAALIRTVHRLLRELCDREVAGFAEIPA